MNNEHKGHMAGHAEGMKMEGMEGHEHRGHDMGGHAGHKMSSNGGHTSHHAMMVADFRRRFWISLIISVPILILSPLIQRFIGLDFRPPFLP